VSTVNTLSSNAVTSSRPLKFVLTARGDLQLTMPNHSQALIPDTDPSAYLVEDTFQEGAHASGMEEGRY
jgi:hypothetical protein